MTAKETMGEAGNDENGKYKEGVNRNARIVVRNISFKATEEALREHFKAYGSVEEVSLLKKPDGRLVGCAFIHYTHVPMANDAIAATNKKPFMGRPIYVSWAVPKHKYGENVESFKPEIAAKTPVKKEENETTKEQKQKLKVNRNARLIIRNVSFKATEETLKQHFEPYGELLEVKLLKKPDGKLVGCAFVHFKNVPMAKKALLNTNMKPFLGRPISVDWAVAKDKYMQHMVNQQVEMQEDVKKEDSDSDDEKPPLNISDEVKKEIKSESDDSDSEGDEDDKSSKASDQSGDDDDDDEDEENSEEENDEDDQNDEDVDMKDDASVTSTVAERKRIQLNDAEDGCTVFLTNVPFSIDNHLLKVFAEKTGPVQYALICVDKMTEHSKGTGFIKFVNKEDADRFLALPSTQLSLDGQVVQVKPALKRENLKSGDDKKQPKDNRNLYLVKEGVIVAGTKAAEGVSASDMAKRLALERSKTQMLKNLNRFVSRYRIVVSNLPQHFDDAKLRKTCAATVSNKAVITEARIMRDLRAPIGRDGKHPSKGYGFVMFMKHEDALTCLRKLNNNPEIFDKNNRPIVSFSIEDRTALNARKKRLEKSIANNPIVKKDDSGNVVSGKRKNRKRKLQVPEESYVKKARFDRKINPNKESDSGKFVRRPAEDVEYSGIKSREGAQHKMRSNYKLKTQAEIHRQTVKSDKKKNKHAMRMKQARRERIKLPKQKINKNLNKKRNKKF